jgi:iron-sulfur cluster repair protein YtfE (RIC family)
LSRVGQDENPDVTAAQKALDIKTQLYQIDYEAHRDTLRAQTDLEKQEIQKRAGDARLALQDQLDEEKALYEATQQERQNLQIAEIEAEKKNALQGLIDQQNEEIAVRNATAVLRAAITDRQTQFDQMQAAQAADFEKSMDDAAFARQVNQIYAERDAKIKAVAEQLADKEKQLTDSAEKERQIILDNLAQQLKDYKSKYIDQITEAFHHAGVDIADFYGLINDHLATQVDATTKKILDMIAQVKNIQQGVFSPNMFPAPAVPLPINAPTYPATTYPGPDVAGIGAFDSGTNNASRVINLQLTVNGAQPVTADQIAREINRSLSLAGV